MVGMFNPQQNTVRTPVPLALACEQELMAAKVPGAGDLCSTVAQPTSQETKRREPSCLMQLMQLSLCAEVLACVKPCQMIQGICWQAPC